MPQTISRCRICKNTQLSAILDLGVQPLNSVYPRSRHQPVPTGPLRLVKCTGDPDVCGLLQLQDTYEPHDLHGETRRSRSRPCIVSISDLNAGLHRALERRAPTTDATIVHFGADDPPTYAAQAQRGLGRHSGCGQSRGDAAFDRKPSIVISAGSALSSLSDPLCLMHEVCDALDEHGIWLLEQIYMPTLLYRNSYDAVCHEHVGYYAIRQIRWLADRVGLKIIDVELDDPEAGTALITLAKEQSHHEQASTVEAALDEEARAGMHTLQPYQSFARRVAAGAALLRTFLDRARDAGRSVCALGASRRGNVILKYCNVTPADITMVGEIDLAKVGAFTPGTLLPIVTEDQILSRRPDYLIVFPWRMRESFVEQPRFAGHNLLFPLPQLELIRPPRTITP